MPLYEYECETCGIRFERKQRMADAPLRTCPECSGPVHRVIQPVGIVFKGSGFYATDHRSPSGNTSHASSKHDEPKTDESKTTEKSEKDSAPAKTSEAAKTAAGENV